MGKLSELSTDTATSDETNSNKRVLVFSFARWEHHLATDLELVQKHLHAGDHVTVMTCVADVPSCRVNISHDSAGCRKCINSRFEALQFVDDSRGNLSLVRLGDVVAQAGTAVELRARFDSIDNARKFTANDWDVGMAACSTAISAFRDHELASAPAQRAWSDLVEAGHRSFCATQELLRREEFNRVYVFNGRDALARGVFRAAQQAGVEVCVHERGRGNDRFALYVDKLPHDRDGYHAAILSSWDQADPIEREALGAKFYERSRAGVDQRWTSFVTDQQPGLLPPGWDPNRKNVVIFNSSEDEYAAIGPDWKNPLYSSQAEGARGLAESLLADGSNLCLWVRMHPNLAEVDNASTRAFAELTELGVHVIESTSDISSYSLVDAADVVVSFGSTVGIEATFWGTPSVALGPSFFAYLDATHRPQSHDEAVRLIASSLEVANRVDALKYGHFLLSQGIPYEHYRADGFHHGKFNGNDIRHGATPLLVIARPLAKLRLSRPATYDRLHPIARGLLHQPFAPIERSWRQLVGWASQQERLRNLWRAAKARRGQSPLGA